MPGRPRSLQLDIEVGATKDVELTGILAALDLAGRGFAQGKVIATGADGTAREISLPLARKGLGDAIRQFTVLDADGTQTVFSLEPPCSVPSDGAARIQLVGSALKAVPQREWPSPSIFQETWAVACCETAAAHRRPGIRFLVRIQA